ncbi:MAG: ABC transporter permease [Synergistaceae bacterium]|jgi:peptide/nickel transport system permease protein|nr:ABC transporter permease [Synergistaceae bacterium]
MSLFSTPGPAGVGEDCADDSRLRDFAAVFFRNRMAKAGIFILAVLIVSAVFAPLIAPYEYDEQDLLATLEWPSREHIFGTDEFGRDIFSRVVYASRISVMVGIVSVTIGIFFGGLLGAAAGFYGGAADDVVMRCIDVLLAIPAILFAIAIAASLGPGLFNMVLAVGISSIPYYARILRGSVLSIREQEFIEASRAVGSSNIRILFRHVIPNCLAPIIVQGTLGVADGILYAAALSFIGLGIQPPTPEWGGMLSGGRSFIRDYSYMTLFPGLAIVITILALNFVGDALRDALDPKLRDR